MIRMDPGTRVIVAAVTFGGLVAVSVSVGHLFGLAAAAAVWAGAAAAFASVAISSRLAVHEQSSPLLSRGDLTFMMHALDDVPGGSMVSIVERDGITGVRAACLSTRKACSTCGSTKRPVMQVDSKLHCGPCREALIATGWRPLDQSLPLCVCGVPCPYTSPEDAGWRFVTQFDGEARWLCTECQREGDDRRHIP